MDTLDTHAKSKAAVFLRIIANCFKNIRVDHAAAHDLDPPGTLTQTAPFAVTNKALNINFCRRLSEREETRPETDLPALAKDLLSEFSQCTFKIAKRYVFINQKTF